MPKSQSPYFVCLGEAHDRYADHALLHPVLQEPPENDHIPQIYNYQEYRWNVDAGTPNFEPWIGLDLIYSILTEMQTLHSPDFIRNNSNEFRRANLERLRHQLINCVPGIFLNSFRILSPVDANQWQNITWNFECFENGLNVISHIGNHRISFNWDNEEYYDEDTDFTSRLRVITVEYTGPFQLERVPQD
jgi:hypothetical protein